jgi:hypothetical protein
MDVGAGDFEHRGANRHCVGNPGWSSLSDRLRLGLFTPVILDWHILPTGGPMKLMNRRSVRWFLLAGCVGLATVITIAFAKPASPAVIFVFWPASIVGLSDPAGFFDKPMQILLMYGGNFLLYGFFGAVAGLAADKGQY